MMTNEEEQGNCVLCQRPLNEGETSSSTLILEHRLEEGESLCSDCEDRLQGLFILSSFIELEDDFDTMLKNLRAVYELGEDTIANGKRIRDAAGYLEPFQERLTRLLDRFP